MLAKHTKVNAVGQSPPLNLFMPDQGPIECTILVVNLLEIDDLLTVCQVSKYMHACVRASTKNDSMAVKCRLKWLRINVEEVNAPDTFEMVMELAKTRGIFPLSFRECIARNLNFEDEMDQCRNGKFVCNVLYVYTPTNSLGALAASTWETRIPSRWGNQILPLVHAPSPLMVCFKTLLDETIFTVRPPMKIPFDETRLPYNIFPSLTFEYDSEGYRNVRCMKKSRANKNRYRLVMGTSIWCGGGDNDTVSYGHSVVTDYIFELEDIIETDKVWKLLADPEWLKKTKPLKFERDWWTNIDELDKLRKKRKPGWRLKYAAAQPLL